MEADYRPNLLLKGMAIVLLYILFGHPSIYPAIWRARNWYVIVLLPVAVAVLVPWCAQVLVWRVRIADAIIEIRSLRGPLTRRLQDLITIERGPARVLVAFKDGTSRGIPAVVGDWIY